MHLDPLIVKKVSLILVACARGNGTPENPERTAFFYYADDGELMACYDPINGPPDSYLVPAIEGVSRKQPKSSIDKK